MFSLNTYQWWPLLFFNAFSEIVLCLPCSNCFNVYLVQIVSMFTFFDAFSEIVWCLSCSLGEARGITSVCARCHHWVENQFWCFKVGVKQWVSIATFFVPSLLDTWVLRLDLKFKFQNLLVVFINLWRFYL